jgi:hypothetical protein
VAKRDSSEQVRRFGPLSGLFVAAAIAFIVLPSTLTLPNPSPTSQEEIAPVPPTASKLNPPVSNFSTLNSGSQGNGLGAGGGGGDRPSTTLPPPPALPPGVGDTPPSTYECVAGRQTEDPLAPTCVPFYVGDNGGATYQGVTAKEVKIVMYYDANSTLNTSQGTSTPPYNQIIDVEAPPKPREHPAITVNRAWQKFFIKRYAAYNRKAHFYVQFGSFDSSGTQTPGSQAQDAALAYAKVKPFAIVNYAGFGNGDFYNNYMAEHGVLIFGSVAGRGSDFYKRYPGRQWGYKPPLEYGAAQYANAICSMIKGKPAVGMGAGSIGSAQNGQARKYGFLYTRDKAWPGIKQQALVAKDLMKKQCNVEMAIEQTYDKNSFSVDNGSTPDYAINIAVAFQNAGVTTVLWPAGYEVKISQAMNNIKYFPEIIVGDDDLQASINGTRFQDQGAWNQAWIVTSQTYDPPASQRICVQEYRTVDQESPASDVANFACDYYNDLRQLFTGIQVAGPTLTPESIDQGYHAIPLVESTNPQVPTCFYLPGDYTCVKDSAIMHWDSSATPPSQSQPGCWRMVGNGKRYLPGKFPTVNLDKLKSSSNVCNNFSQAANLSLV